MKDKTQVNLLPNHQNKLWLGPQVLLKRSPIRSQQKYYRKIKIKFLKGNANGKEEPVTQQKWPWVRMQVGFLPTLVGAVSEEDSGGKPQPSQIRFLTELIRLHTIYITHICIAKKKPEFDLFDR